MAKFGTSENKVFASGRQLTVTKFVEEICQVCKMSPQGPTNFGIYSEDESSATLICPNCGEIKRVRKSEMTLKVDKESNE